MRPDNWRVPTEPVTVIRFGLYPQKIVRVILMSGQPRKAGKRRKTAEGYDLTTARNRAAAVGRRAAKPRIDISLRLPYPWGHGSK